MKRLLLTATVLGSFSLVSGQARAQPVDGLYVGAGVGPNFIANEFDKFNYSGRNAAGPFQGSGKNKLSFDTGIAALGSVGYGFGNGLRLEVEGNYRYNKLQHGGSNGPYAQKYGGMGNALFDFDVGSPYVFPYVGAGVGYIQRDNNGGVPYFSSGTVAYQGIAGLAFPLPFLVGLSATLEYRFLNAGGVSHKASFNSPGFNELVQDKYVNDLNHSVMVGLRYQFDVAPPPPVPQPVAAPVAAPTRSYLVFFDWDRSDLTARARQIVAEAAGNVQHVTHTRIEVDGHADRSGQAQYNQRLSLRRADTVAAELVRDGVPRSDIAIQAFGDTRPLVQTAAGVREPQNRRVEIVIK